MIFDIVNYYIIYFSIILIYFYVTYKWKNKYELYLAFRTFKHDLQKVICRSAKRFLKYLVLNGAGHFIVNTVHGSMLLNTFLPTTMVEVFDFS